MNAQHRQMHRFVAMLSIDVRFGLSNGFMWTSKPGSKFVIGDSTFKRKDIILCVYATEIH
jgi:hypothetical protein